MKLLLEVEKDKFSAGETVIVRFLVLNNGYEPAVLDRRLLVGPNPVLERSAGAPIPISVEPSLPREEQNLITLNPWCFYGRQRTFDNFPPGQVIFHGYLLRQSSDLLLSERPAEPDALLVSAEPLVVTIEGGS
jgi:hypothetical protein